MTPDEIHQIIFRIQTEGVNYVNPGRYPFTYALDYIRTHRSEFGFDQDISRSEATAWLRKEFNQPEFGYTRTYIGVLRSLADAYLKEFQLVWRSTKEEIAALENIDRLRTVD